MTNFLKSIKNKMAARKERKRQEKIQDLKKVCEELNTTYSDIFYFVCMSKRGEIFVPREFVVSEEDMQINFLFFMGNEAEKKVSRMSADDISMLGGLENCRSRWIKARSRLERLGFKISEKNE